jgi:hypothetical protein
LYFDAFLPETAAMEHPVGLDKESGDVSIRETPPRPRSWKQKARAVIWDSLDKPPEERKFLAKIDWWILSYCCVGYFVKYLDQTNVSQHLAPRSASQLTLLAQVSNAYVSGMQDALGMHGNQLNLLTTYWNIGKSRILAGGLVRSVSPLPRLIDLQAISSASCPRSLH